MIDLQTVRPMLTINTLRSLQPLQSILPSQLEAVLAAIEQHWLLPGSCLFNVGEHDTKHYFLQYGQAECLLPDGSLTVIDACHMLLPIGDEQPRPFTFKALTDCSVLSIERETLDKLLTWSQVAEYLLSDIDFDRNLDEDANWMSSILRSNLFLKVPPTNMGKIFQYIKSQTVYKGEVIVRQGEYGDRCYFIKEGHATVTRRLVEDSKLEYVADIESGRCFGEDALVYDKVRNANVTMVSDGVLMVLEKQDFLELLKPPSCPLLSWSEWLQESTTSKTIIIDVRTQAEYDQGHLIQAINIPLNLLRLKSRILPKGNRYVLYCDTGRRSEAATYLLGQLGFDALALKQGFRRAPSNERAKRWTQQDYLIKNSQVLAGQF